MGYESPLYGRATATLEVFPFDYLDGAKFFPKYSDTHKLIAYGILGGIPRYLNAFSGECSIHEAIARGYNKIVEIADCIHEDKGKCSKYMVTLLAIRLVEKKYPAENQRGAKRRFMP